MATSEAGHQSWGFQVDAGHSNEHSDVLRPPCVEYCWNGHLHSNAQPLLRNKSISISEMCLNRLMINDHYSWCSISLCSPECALLIAQCWKLMFLVWLTMIWTVVNWTITNYYQTLFTTTSNYISFFQSLHNFEVYESHSVSRETWWAAWGAAKKPKKQKKVGTTWEPSVKDGWGLRMSNTNNQTVLNFQPISTMKPPPSDLFFGVYWFASLSWTPPKCASSGYGAEQGVTFCDFLF